MDISILAGSCTNGFSEMVSQAASAVTTFLFNRTMMKLLREDGVAAITIMIYTQFLLTALYIGFSMGVAPVISYNYGKQDNARLKKIFFICMRFIILVSMVIFGAAIAVQLFVLRAEHFYFRRIHRIVKREAVGGIILSADVRADTRIFAHPAGICGSGGCVAGSADSRAAYNDGGADLSLSQQRQVSLRIETGFKRRETPLLERATNIGRL